MESLLVDKVVEKLRNMQVSDTESEKRLMSPSEMQALARLRSFAPSKQRRHASNDYQPRRGDHSKRGRKGNGMPRNPRKMLRPRIDNIFSNRQETIRVRITIPSAAVSSTAGSIIAVGSTTTDSARASGTEFGSYSARFTHWRCHRMTMCFSPKYPTNTDATLALGHTDFYIAPFWGIESTVPTSTATILSIPGCKVHPTFKEFSVTIGWKGYMDSHLWSPVNAAQPTDQTFAFYYASSTQALLPVSQVIFLLHIIYDVEFATII